MHAWRTAIAILPLAVHGFGASGPLSACPAPINFVQPRRDILELWQGATTEDVRQRDLFFLSMRALAESPPSDPESMYQLAGLHGSPGVPYDGVFNEEFGPWYDSTKGYSKSYGNWDNALFTLWHRTYIIRFEEVLRKRATEIAAQYPRESRAAFDCSAQRLRLPYLDWASRATAEQGIPAALWTEQLEVEAPEGSIVITNPLKRYHYQATTAYSSADGHTAEDWCSRKGDPITRWPNTQDCRAPDFLAQNETAMVHASIGLAATCAQPLAYNFLVNARTWEHANLLESRDGEAFPASIPPLKLVHNIGHRMIGGGPLAGGPWAAFGTTTDPSPHQSFDPFFWLHHSQLDKMLMMFQELNPTEFFDAWMDTEHGTCMWLPNTPEAMITGKTPLWPFRKGGYGSKTDMWTAEEVRHPTQSFGYTYAEVADAPSREQLLERIEALYNYDGKWSNGGGVGVCPLCVRSVKDASVNLRDASSSISRLADLSWQWTNC